jgi:hypothetical protein
LQDPGAENGAAYGENHGCRFTVEQRILWDGNWKFVFNGFDYDELYDLATDPFETNNVAAAHPDRCQQMMTLIWQRIHATDDDAMLGTHYPPMRMACVGPNTGQPSPTRSHP